MESATTYLDRLCRRERDPTRWDWEATLERAYSLLLPAGAVVVDVGAHRGRHLRVFHGTLGCSQVWAVEPQEQEFEALRSEFQERKGITLVNKALGTEPGAATFTINSAAPEESGLRRRRYNDEAGARVREVEVEVTTLDQLLLATAPPASLDFLKIDVEGGELGVLRGGIECLQRYRPLISVEFGSASFDAYELKAEDLYDLAAELDYALTDLLGHPFRDRESWSAAVDRYYWDYLLVPRERLAWVNGRLARDAWPVPVDASMTGRWPRVLPRRLSDVLRRLLSRRGRVDALICSEYRELLGREPDPDGLAYYRKAMLEGQVDQEGLRRALRASSEFKARSG